MVGFSSSSCKIATQMPRQFDWKMLFCATGWGGSLDTVCTVSAFAAPSIVFGSRTMAHGKRRKQSLWTRIRKKIDVAVIVTACISAVAIDIAKDAWTGTKIVSHSAWNRLSTPSVPTKGVSDGYFGDGAISDGYFSVLYSWGTGSPEQFDYGWATGGPIEDRRSKLKSGSFDTAWDTAPTTYDSLGGEYDSGWGTGSSSLAREHGRLLGPSKLT